MKDTIMKDTREFTIYVIENTLNGKKYVGQTCQDIELRFKQHKGLASKELDDRRSYIHKAIKKHGVNNFTFYAIDSCIGSKAADTLEINYIRVLDTLVPNGYNIREGGNNTHSDHRRKVSTKITINGVTYPSISSAAKSHGMSFSKFVNFLNGRTKEQKFSIILNGETYSSLSEAATKLGVSSCKIKYLLEGKQPQKKEVTIEGVKYSSKKEAADSLGVGRSVLDRILSGKEKVEPIKITYQGVTYNSQSEACRCLKVHPTTLKKMIKENREKLDTLHPVCIHGIQYRTISEAKKETGYSYEKIIRLSNGGDIINREVIIDSVKYNNKTDAMNKLNLTLRQINRAIATGSSEAKPNIKRKVWFNGVLYNSMLDLTKASGLGKDQIYRMAADGEGIEFVPIDN